MIRRVPVYSEQQLNLESFVEFSSVHHWTKISFDRWERRIDNGRVMVMTNPEGHYVIVTYPSDSYPSALVTTDVTAVDREPQGDR